MLNAQKCIFRPLRPLYNYPSTGVCPSDCSGNSPMFLSASHFRAKRWWLVVKHVLSRISPRSHQRLTSLPPPPRAMCRRQTNTKAASYRHDYITALCSGLYSLNSDNGARRVLSFSYPRFDVGGRCCYGCRCSYITSQAQEDPGGLHSRTCRRKVEDVTWNMRDPPRLSILHVGDRKCGRATSVW